MYWNFQACFNFSANNQNYFVCNPLKLLCEEMPILHLGQTLHCRVHYWCVALLTAKYKADLKYRYFCMRGHFQHALSPTDSSKIVFSFDSAPVHSRLWIVVFNLETAHAFSSSTHGHCHSKRKIHDLRELLYVAFVLTDVCLHAGSAHASSQTETEQKRRKKILSLCSFLLLNQYYFPSGED